jgi:alpha-beta hydrolase superfamily lysophospholipase
MRRAVALAAAVLAAAALAAAGCAAPQYRAGTPRVLYQAAADVRHESALFAGAGGVTLFAQSFRPPGAAKAAVVLVHGLKGTSNQYGPAAEVLTRHGYAVYAFDLRGHGNSEGRRVWIDSFSQFLDDLGIFLDRVRQAEPGRPVFLFGHSMGGAIVAEMALLRHPAVRGIVLCAAALRLTPDVTPFKVRAIRAFARSSPRLGVLTVPNRGFSRDPAVVAAMDHDPLIYNHAGPARTAVELVAAIEHIQGHMEELTQPLLILHGTGDRVTNLEGSRQLYERARSTDKTLKLYEGHLHGLLQDLGKEQVLADLVAWMDARLGAAP